MGTSIVEERRAVECGYWPLFRYNPLMLESGLEPYIEDAVDSSIKVNGLPEKGAPSAAEDADASAASLGPWNKVADEASPLTVDAVGEPSGLVGFLDGEDRYADLRMVAPGETDAIRSAMAARLGREARLLDESPLRRPD